MSVAVASHSFPKHATLRRELEAHYPDASYNTTGRPLAGDDLVRFLRGHELAITGLEVLDQAVFAAVPELRIVSKYGVGLDMIDLAAASRSGVSVRWTGGVNRQAVAELAIAFMLVLGRSTVALAREMRDGGWRQPGGRQLSSASVGIVDEAALKAALIEGRLAGAACDVYAIEPPVDRELLLLPNFVGTPHIGGSTEEAALAMGRAAITGLGDPARQIS